MWEFCIHCWFFLKKRNCIIVYGGNNVYLCSLFQMPPQHTHIHNPSHIKMKNKYILSTQSWISITASVRGLRKSNTCGSGLWIIKWNQFGLCCTPRLRHSVSDIRWHLGTCWAMSGGKITCLQMKIKTFFPIFIINAIYRTKCDILLLVQNVYGLYPKQNNAANLVR